MKTLSDLIEEGYTLNDLSDFLKIPYITIRRKLKKYGLKTKPNIKSKVIVCCEKCSTHFKALKRDNRKFCSRKCSIEHNNDILKNNRIIINEKISKSLLKNETIETNCLNCNKNFIKNRETTKYCSRSCKAKHMSNKPEVKERISKFFSDLAKERYKNGDTTIGWKTRNKLTPSYPEKVTISYFDNNNILYEREFKVGKYFIDFAFIDIKIALEIDGRTHNDIEVIQKDIQKDNYLKSNGWLVYRIKWVNDKNHHNRIDEFLEKFSISGI